MKNQRLVIMLLVAFLLRNLFPFADLFLVVLVIQILLNADTVPIIAILSALVSFIVSITTDNPIGLFPLILVTLLFVFGTFTQKIAGKGVAPLFYWSLFAGIVLFLEKGLRLVLTTGVFLIPPETIYRVFGTIASISIIVFLLSFKRKI